MYDKTPKLKELSNYASDKGFPTIGFFDYGYCMSVHKSQGSEWQKVIVFEQRTKRWDDNYYAKWLYTAITRAKEKLFIIGDYWG
jgi:ATP-dependent exoDNAse (exonuclease V) alpha subunit